MRKHFHFILPVVLILASILEIFKTVELEKQKIKMRKKIMSLLYGLAYFA